MEYRENCIVIEVHKGPDSQGRHSFFMYWPDDNIGRGLNEKGMRGQIFLSVLFPRVEKAKAEGKDVFFKCSVCSKLVKESWFDGDYSLLICDSEKCFDVIKMRIK